LFYNEEIICSFEYTLSKTVGARYVTNLNFPGSIKYTIRLRKFYIRQRMLGSRKIFITEYLPENVMSHNPSRESKAFLLNLT
jgi:hypothetical protein